MQTALYRERERLLKRAPREACVAFGIVHMMTVVTYVYVRWVGGGFGLLELYVVARTIRAVVAV